MKRCQWWCLVVLFAIGLSAQAEVLYNEKSLYRNIFVYEDDGLRCMKFGRYAGGRQSCIQLSNPDALVFNYTKMMMGALYLNPHPQHVLIIGLGGGTLPSTLKKLFPAVEIDVAEIDPAVVKVASRFFDFSPSKQIHIHEEDGRVFVKHALRQKAKYDLVMLDAFDHEYIPEHMLTREFLQEVRGILAPKGVLAANTFSTSRLYNYESATYTSVYGDFYSLKVGNRVILLRNDGLPSMTEITQNSQLLQDKLSTFGVSSAWVLALFGIDKSWDHSARVLTDQYAPSNLLNAN